MESLLRRFERAMIAVLIAMVAVLVALAALDLGWLIIKDLITPPVVLLDINELLDLLGFVLIVLIGIELLETIKGYLHEHVIHVEVVLDVGLIAIARKVITLDLEKATPLVMVGMGVVALALGVARYLVTCHRVPGKRLSQPPGDEQPPLGQ